MNGKKVILPVKKELKMRIYMFRSIVAVFTAKWTESLKKGELPDSKLIRSKFSFNLSIFR